LIEEWVFIAWHLKGAPDLDTWLSIPDRRRSLIIAAVGERIEKHNSAFPDV
jgi:hypothetical protein